MEFASRPSSLSSVGLAPPAPSSTQASQQNVRYYHPAVLSQIREDCMAQKLYLRASEFTEIKDMVLWAGTFNVNAKKPVSIAEAAKLLYWLRPKHDNDHLSPDIVAVGFQEIVDLNAVNVVVNNTSGPRSAQWEESILAALNSHMSDDAYEVVLHKHLVGILLLVFVKRDHLPFVTDVVGSTAGVGIMGMMGNKGGVAVRMTLYDSTMCFVCSHLAAHTHNVAGRNADFANILSKIEFRDSIYDELNPMGSQEAADHALTIHMHDFIFWLGDLNYRLVEDANFTVDDCFAHVEKQNLDVLLARDQLNQEREKGNVFHGFEEGPIRFPPTYKFQAGTSFYDRRPEKKIRAPAWCDRILWKAKADTVALKHYGAAMELDMSDHKPVAALFTVKVKYEVDEKKDAVQREISRELDKWESDNKPKISISDHNLLHFDAVTYLVPQTKTFLIENTGLVVAHFQLAPKLQESAVSKSWLTVLPTYGMIPPKEKVELKVTVHVMLDAVHALSSGRDTLDDTLILRVANGADHFLVVSGDFLPSCFGCSLEQLVVQVEPVRSVKSIKREAAVSQKIPKELWRMVDALYTHGLDAPNIFLDTDQSEAAVLREALDTGAPFPVHRPQSMAALLVHWLQSLRESVVPEASLSADTTASVTVDGLATVHFNTFIYVSSFLREVLLHTPRNLLNTSKIAHVFGRCLLGYSVTQGPSPKIDMMERMLVHFLTTGTL
ncbi:hypothetical protein H310_04696 [Aphanomyces invadans]|uniref:Rho-GAP domain-containing protein n=1 Tax=Aphanomyces invadans TaxID=157072 RepID=A0A024UE12_9STRA|nr:hypothetical protein H310_04696 [Aphanomyces invadans]ETW04415.1 hypothetical protein H310_04696 [Aphanomyces invadans]|eukprot:XP_008867371.1 hypothetical protein H310_04696 [Aphanomyces invadans]